MGFFVFDLGARVRNRQTNGRTDGRDPCYGLLGRPHNKRKTFLRSSHYDCI